MLIYESQETIKIIVLLLNREKYYLNNYNYNKYVSNIHIK